MRLDRILTIVLITFPNSLSYFPYIKKKKREKEKKSKKNQKPSEDNRSKLSIIVIFFFFNNVIIETKKEGDYALNASTDYRDSLALSFNGKVNQNFFFSADNSRRYVCFCATDSTTTGSDKVIMVVKVNNR